MTALELLLAGAGLVVTMLVVAGMILITPRGEVPLDRAVRDGQGETLSRADAPQREPTPARATSAAGAQAAVDGESTQLSS
jgi:hypothetical protein